MTGFENFFPIIAMVLLFGALYFFMIRPQKKQEKKDAEMRNSLQVGDEVTTIGGIIGKVVSVKGETFVLETTKDKTKIRFLKGAIRTVDVKAADLAAAVMEGNSDEAPSANEAANDTSVAEESPREKAKREKREAKEKKAAEAKAAKEAKKAAKEAAKAEK